MTKAIKVSLTTAQRIDRNFEVATLAFEAGFKSEAARKRALSELNYAYGYLRSDFHTSVIDAGRVAFPDALNQNPEQYAAYCDHLNAFEVPFDLSAIRPKHIPLFSTEEQNTIQALVDLRKAIKGAEIVLVEVSENVKRAEVVRKTIKEEMDARKQSYINGYDLSKHFGLHVYANAHYVRHCKGTEFVRTFYYLNGNLTALNIIIAIAEQLVRDDEN